MSAAVRAGRRVSVSEEFTQPLAGAHLHFIFSHDTEPMDTHPYQIGDRVRLAQPCFGMPAGTAGVIAFIYRTARHLYRVYFAPRGIAVTLHSCGFVVDQSATPATLPSVR
jgi:hypothetical protein